MTIKREKGFALILVLVLMAMGAMAVTPALRLASTSLKSKQIHTDLLKDQYARDGAAEYAIWQLHHGGLPSTIQPEENEEYVVVLNGISADVVISMRTELGTSTIPGAEGNRLHISQSVECDEDAAGRWQDDCMTLPQIDDMAARFTISITQIGPDIEPLEYMYEEFPEKFEGMINLQNIDNFPEISSVTPENIGWPQNNIVSPQNQIWEWDFSSAPVTFVQDEVKTFSFETVIPQDENLYCNGIFLKLQQPPNEKADKREANVNVGNKEDEGCKGGGMSSEKFVDTLVVPPGQTTILTYIANVVNIENNSAQIEEIKDVLPQGGFQWCDPSSPPPTFTCDDPMYKKVADPFDPDVDSFTDTSGFSNLPDPTETLSNGRWELVWDDGWGMGQAGKVDDTFIIRFMVHTAPTESGSYYNEIFIDNNCFPPNVLVDKNVTTPEEYCASYSWPSGGTLVPMYDVQSNAESTSGQGNVSIGVDVASLQSWNVDDIPAQ